MELLARAWLVTTGPLLCAAASSLLAEEEDAKDRGFCRCLCGAPRHVGAVVGVTGDAMLSPHVHTESDFPLRSLGPLPGRQRGAVRMWGCGDVGMGSEHPTVPVPHAPSQVTHILGVTRPAGDFPGRRMTTMDLPREGLHKEQETLLAWV